MIEMKKYILFILFVCFLQSCGSKRVIYNYEDDRKEIPVKKKKTKKKKKVKDKKPIIPVIRTTEDYIAYYSEIAMDEMKQYKIPASITLAQGILESGSGKGRLAVKANNHFGIKCHDWNGPKIYHDDDRKQECFRKYSSPEFSFRDHSIFLKSRDRYSDLFKLKRDEKKIIKMIVIKRDLISCPLNSSSLKEFPIFFSYLLTLKIKINLFTG